MKTYFIILTVLISFSSIFAKDVKSCVKDTPFQCDVRLPQDEKESGVCFYERIQSTEQEKKYWHFAETKNPGDPNDDNELLTPRLNQTQATVAAKARFGKDDMQWFSLYYTLTSLLNTTATYLQHKGFLSDPMTSYTSYKRLYAAFNSAVGNIAKYAPNEFSVPSNRPGFTDIVSTDLWRKDEYFVQRRLAGACPYFLRKVTLDGQTGLGYQDLNKNLNNNFEWEEQLRKVTGDNKATFLKMIKKKRLFVLYHEEYNDLDRSRDILDPSPLDNITLMGSPSPITLFVIKERELKIIAIQTNYTKDSKVVVPSDDIDNQEWLIAKASVEIVDMAMCQIKGHLLDSHVTAESYCNLFRGELSDRHPLYGVFSAHCEGTTPVGALGITALVNEMRYMHQLFEIGYIGTRQLINKLYVKHKYEDSDFEIQLKNQGLYDADLEYYPYRDDGKLIWEAIGDFATKYVDIYYKKDKNVEEDWEINSFANEMSADGNAKYGAKYKGFPKELKTKSDLGKLLQRFIWLPVLHAANSYPLLPYSGYTPIAPTKLYNDPNSNGNFAHNLPNAAVTMTQSILTFTLASFRINRLFDYSKKLQHQKGRCLVRETFAKLQTCVQPTLEERNKERSNRTQLVYPFMEPYWLTNSISS